MSASAEGGIRFGQYVLLRRIARGGMAEVFLAQQRGLEGFDRRVAVKRILPHLSDAPDFVQMFLGEARLAAQLNHPNIVHIYDFGKVESDYFIAMEYVDGVHAGRLFKHVEQERLPPVMVARLGADTAAALHHAHELRANGKPLGLVHRDVSPANLMVSFDGVVKLCDFGIAKAAALGDQLTNPGQVKGKYAYMSPEQTIAAPLDGRSDVFSLAIVLWELMAGKPIVTRGDAVEAMRAIRDGRLPPISQVAPWTPPPLAKAISWGLETHRERRATALQLAHALEAFIKSSPELATPLQLGAWVRARFSPDQSAQEIALPLSPAEPGTMAAPPTMVPGTVLAPGTMIAPGTVVLTPPRPLTRTSELAQPSAIAAPLSHAQGAPQPAPGPASLPPPSLPSPGVPKPYAPASLDLSMSGTIERASESDLARTIDLQPTVYTGDESTVATPIDLGAIDAGHDTVLGPPIHDADDDAQTYDNFARGAQRPMTVDLPAPTVAAPPLLDPLPRVPVPPLVRTSAPPRPDPVRAREPVSRVTRAITESPAELRRRINRRNMLAVGGLVALAGASFAIALAARSCADSPAMAILADAPTTDGGAAALPAVPADAPVLDWASLSITTTPPGATIRVGDNSGTSPTSFQLPPGTYQIVATLDGYELEQRAVSVSTVDTSQHITFARPIADLPRGRLMAKTTPASFVWNGARRLGQTPIEIELPAGDYTLTFRHPQRPVAIKQVTIKAGETTKLTFALER
ncbi:MAG: protein kinase [Kofleriaceae bacterium]